MVLRPCRHRAIACLLTACLVGCAHGVATDEDGGTGLVEALPGPDEGAAVDGAETKAG